MKPRRPDLIADAYRDGCKEAALETGLPAKTFPTDAPFAIEQAEDEAFWPLSR